MPLPDELQKLAALPPERQREIMATLTRVEREALSRVLIEHERATLAANGSELERVLYRTPPSDIEDISKAAGIDRDGAERVIRRHFPDNQWPPYTAHGQVQTHTGQLIARLCAAAPDEFIDWLDEQIYAEYPPQEPPRMPFDDDFLKTGERRPGD